MNRLSHQKGEHLLLDSNYIEVAGEGQLPQPETHGGEGKLPKKTYEGDGQLQSAQPTTARYNQCGLSCCNTISTTIRHPSMWLELL